MVKARSNPNIHNIHQYLVVGRNVPTQKEANPRIYKMRIFANDVVHAKSKFWYFLKRLNKIKRSVGEVLSVNEVRSIIFIIRSSRKTLPKSRLSELSVPTNPNSDITPYTRSSEAPPLTELLLNYVNI